MEKELYDINNYVDRIFYINMDKDIERNENMIKQFRKHGIWNYERMPGIVIESIPENHRILGPFNNNTDIETYVKGSIGALFSHKKIIEIAMERKYSRICIFEDDITLIDNFKENFYTYIENLNSQNPTYQIAYLGLSNNLEEDKIFKIKEVKSHAYGAYGYIINDQGWVFQYILQNIDFVFQEIDLLYNSLLSQNLLSYCYVFVPNIVKHDWNFGSNIGNNKTNLI